MGVAPVLALSEGHHDPVSSSMNVIHSIEGLTIRINT